MAPADFTVCVLPARTEPGTNKLIGLDQRDRLLCEINHLSLPCCCSRYRTPAKKQPRTDSPSGHDDSTPLRGSLGPNAHSPVSFIINKTRKQEQGWSLHAWTAWINQGYNPAGDAEDQCRICSVFVLSCAASRWLNDKGERRRDHEKRGK